ncbi:YcjF family protein [Defluviimonas salinarum]|uniref:YcjF family protein n=1 Tax=Defluviimonas salinarum TaxID=2992147 RepID=A0ABT3J8R5_9RHOB|nr:YcjF family protein [Defluviimonas salinarum]MCW3784077.1 YcjF family protein [Defluviimonas salinarum]
MTKPKGPVLIEMERPAAEGPAEAPPVPELQPEGQSMQTVAALGARRRSPLGRFFWTTAGALFGFVLSISAWRFVETLLSQNPLLGGIAAALVGLFLLAAVLIALREWAAYGRLARLDRVHRAALDALASGDLKQANRVADRLVALYEAREDTAWGRSRLAERRGEVFDADALLTLAEAELMAPLDRAARAEIEASSRQVATVTAIVPLALADVAAALIANLRMVRRIAEIYGGRAGTIGSWRLLRAVLAHLVATGAVAVGDDLIQSVAGGGLLSKLSRRFGEGVINGALTARVGVAAIEVCRPLPFAALPKPKVTNLVSRGLAGLFGGAGETKGNS